MTTNTPRAPGAPLPYPTIGPVVYPVKFHLSEGENACLCALAQRLGLPPHGLAASLLCSELRRQYAALPSPAPDVPVGQLTLPLMQSQGAARHA